MITLDTAGRADVTEHADFALGRSGVADSPPVKDEQVREQCPIFAGKQRHQILLYFDRILLLREAEAETQPSHVSVDDYAFVLPERVAKDDVCGLASDAGKLDESVHRIWHLAVVALDQSLAESDQALRLVAEEPRALDDLLQFFRRRIGERDGRWKSVKEQRRHHVHALVGALCAQD